MIRAKATRKEVERAHLQPQLQKKWEQGHGRRARC